MVSQQQVLFHPETVDEDDTPPLPKLKPKYFRYEGRHPPMSFIARVYTAVYYVIKLLIKGGLSHLLTRRGQSFCPQTGSTDILASFRGTVMFIYIMKCWLWSLAADLVLPVKSVTIATWNMPSDS